MKGQPWTVEEEKQLREMLQEHRRLNEIAAFFGKSPESVKKKINRLGLVVVVRKIQQTTTSNDLSSVEKKCSKDLIMRWFSWRRLGLWRAGLPDYSCANMSNSYYSFFP